MSFTDDDLKRLKEWSEYECFLSVDIKDIRRLLPGLISRLEAAEILLERLTNPEEDYTLPDVDKDHELYLAWRRAAGK